jgi:KDO2-lipid IV(A) lauroyltransferase
MISRCRPNVRLREGAGRSSIPGEEKAVDLAKRIASDLGWAALRLSDSLTRVRGPGFAVTVGRPVGLLLWTLLGKRRRLCLDNARVALPDLSARARRRIVREAAVNSASFWPELASYCYCGPNRILSNVEVEGRERLDSALGRGRGVVAPGIHMGNFPLIGTWMHAAGYRFDFVMRYPHDERVSRWFTRLRRIEGIGAMRDLPRLACMRGCLGALSANGIVFMPLDMRSGRSGVEVPFFGRPYRAFTGPVALPAKTGAAVLPMYIVRVKGPRHRLVVEPELPLERTGDKTADARRNLERLMGRFEEWVRAHPEQWWWFNRRWERQRPPQRHGDTEKGE